MEVNELKNTINDLIGENGNLDFESLQFPLKRAPKELTDMFKGVPIEGMTYFTTEMYYNTKPFLRVFTENDDRFNIDHEYLNAWRKYYEIDENEDFYRMPGDIFAANTIPLKTLKVKADNCSDSYIYILPDEIRNKNIRDMINNHEKSAIIGYVVFDSSNITFKQGWVKFYLEISIDDTFSAIGLNTITYVEHSNSLSENFNQRKIDKLINGECSYMEGIEIATTSGFVDLIPSCKDSAMKILAIWYVLQQCILNDKLKVFVKTSRVEKENKNNNKKKNNKNKKYITQYRIDFISMNKKYDINPLDEYDSDKYKKKKPLWYVVGHWRTYKKSGKKVFIQGYWKGNLREKKETIENYEPVEIVTDLSGIDMDVNMFPNFD